MAEDWGTAGIDSFVSNVERSHGRCDVSKVALPRPYVVCVVGASRGIGAGIALSYARAGASTIILASRRISGLEETAVECKKANPQVETVIISCDITRSDSVAALATSIHEQCGRLDVVVVNSGYSGQVCLKVTEADPTEFATAMDVNYIGTFLCAKYLIPLLLGTTTGAKAFVAIGSLAAMLVRGPIANTGYCVSKTAQLQLITHIHEQFHGKGLSAFAVHPGAVMTEMAEESAPQEFREYLTDPTDLAGSFAVWLTKGDDMRWLCGRQLSATWDVDELVARKEEIITKDLLKLKLTL